MNNLQSRQKKIQSKRKQTPWRDFVMEICSWGNVGFYRNNGLLSRFPESDRSIVIKTIDWENTGNQMIDMYKSGNFFENLSNHFKKISMPQTLSSGSNENCDFSDTGGYSKNVYLSIIYGGESENIFYTRNTKLSQNVLASNSVRAGSDSVMQSTLITNSFEVFYSIGIEGSRQIRFSSNLVGCEHCILCNGLQNQKWMIRNVQYTQEEYEKQKIEMFFNKNDYHALYDIMKKNSILPINCKDLEQSYYTSNINKGRNVLFSGGLQEKESFYDVLAGGMKSDFYGVYQGVFFAEHVYCSAHITGGSHIFYSYNCTQCSFCLGCIGLKNKSYCILNKQYTKEERYEKVDEIFTQMEKDGQLGEFFPATMNPFYFNDTAAYLIDSSFTKEEVTAKGYLRRDEPIKVDIPEGMEIVYTSFPSLLPAPQDISCQINPLQGQKGDHKTLDDFEGYDDQGNRTINADILKKVIQDEQGNVYRIIPMEYKFLVKHGLPLPRKHWLERMKENFRIS